LGLKAVYEYKESESFSPYSHTEIVRMEFARTFGIGDSMHGGHYDPPPALNLDFIANIISKELQNFYISQPNGAFTLNGQIPCSVSIGIAGYCDSTQQFRIFTVAPNGEVDGYHREIPYPAIQVLELENEKMLLLGSDGEHINIEAEIQSVVLHNTENHQFHKLDLARQTVIESKISNGRWNGVGGDIRRAVVTKDLGFNIVHERWSPKEKLVFAKLNHLL
jgi:hypothetical protein